MNIYRTVNLSRIVKPKLEFLYQNLGFKNFISSRPATVFAILLLTVFLSSAKSSAQNPKTADILRQLTETIKSMPAIDMSFELIQNSSAGGQNGLSEGKAASISNKAGTPIYKGVVNAQGASYKLSNPELELYCDGTTKWILNVPAKELVIVPNDPSATDIVENPLGFLTSLNKGYEYPFRVFSGSRNGKEIWVIELTPVNKRLAYKSISVGVEKNSYIPRMIKYMAKDGSSYIINITGFERVNTLRPKDYFKFPASRLPGLQINDMR